MAEHFFGGDWTEIKLSILRDYLKFYTQALSEKFKVVYIDAFAGTGERQVKRSALTVFGEKGIIDEEGDETIIETLAGSARIALDLAIPFDEYHFIEQHPKRYKRLTEVLDEYKAKRKTYHHSGDANLELSKIISTFDYNTRAVLFLDPYGLSVEWSTLQAISKTKKIDVWFLFSLSGLVRNLTKDFTKLEDYKKARINAILGTSDWQTAHYNNDEAMPKQLDLLTSNQDDSPTRTSNIKDLERYVHERLLTLFSHVEKPVPLPAKGSQQFSLFLCVSNDSKAAIKLASKVAQHIITKHQ